MAGRLHDRFAQTFGRDTIFMDVDHIPAGVDFVTHLNSQVASCEVVLVIIGPNWLRAKDKAGQRRCTKRRTLLRSKSQRRSPATFVSSPF
jgi:hypothetical protein